MRRVRVEVGAHDINGRHMEMHKYNREYDVVAETQYSFTIIVNGAERTFHKRFIEYFYN